MLHFPDLALQTGHFTCYSHRTHHLLPTPHGFFLDQVVFLN